MQHCTWSLAMFRMEVSGEEDQFGSLAGSLAAEAIDPTQGQG
jgi:hypothetical protein